MAIVASGFSRKALAAGALVATVILGAQTWHKAFRVDGNDLTSYLLSARALWDGRSPYGLETPFPYLYPLFLACVMVPLTLLPYGAAVIAWFVASVAALASVLRRWSRGSELAIAAAVLVTFAIIQNNLLNGQVNFFVVLCCALAVASAGPPSAFAHRASADEQGARLRAERSGEASPKSWQRRGLHVGLASRGRRELVAGAWLGVGIAIKLMPVLLVVYFLVRRQFRAIVAAVVTAVVLMLVPGILASGSTSVESGFSRIAAIYAQYMREVLAPMTNTPEGSVLAYSAASVVQRMVGAGPALWIDALCAAAVLGTIALVDVRRWRRRGDDLAAAAAYLVAIVLISPKSETHHVAFAIPAVAMCFAWFFRELPVGPPAAFAKAAAAKEGGHYVRLLTAHMTQLPALTVLLSAAAVMAAPFAGAAEGPMITAAMVLLIAAASQISTTRTPR